MDAHTKITGKFTCPSLIDPDNMFYKGGITEFFE